MDNLLLISKQQHAEILSALHDLRRLSGEDPKVLEVLRNAESIDYPTLLSDRLKSLDGYLNSKECQYLGCLLADYDGGVANLVTLQAFFEIVPEGQYDGDRLKWRKLTMERESEIVSAFKLAQK